MPVENYPLAVQEYITRERNGNTSTCNSVLPVRRTVTCKAPSSMEVSPKSLEALLRLASAYEVS